MENHEIEPSPVPSLFWALIALLRREPGMEWLPQGPAGSCSPGGVEADSEEGEEGTADELGRIPEGSPLGPEPLKALLLLEDSGDNNLWQTYYQGLKTFIAFRNYMALSAVWPLPVDQVREFLLFMESQDLPPAEIITYAEGLSFISGMAKHPEPLRDPVIRDVISRLKSRISSANYGYAPVTVQVLRSLLGTLESVCSSPYECMLFRAMFTVAFFAELHVEEMVANHHNRLQPELLHLTDLRLTNAGVSLSVHRGQERHLINLRLSRELWICPTEALRTYVAARPQGEGPLFVHLDGTAVTRRHFLTVFRRALGVIGHPPKRYGVHSFLLQSVVRTVSPEDYDEASSRSARWLWRS